MVDTDTNSTTEAQSQHIVVIDDEAAIAELVSQIFKAEGFEVSSFLNATEALEFLASEPADLVIADIMMPQMDGLEFCRRLRNFSDIPVVFLTAKDEETDVVVGFAMGADDYIAKPFKPRELVARVRARLRRSNNVNNSQAPEELLSSCGITLNPNAHTASLHDIALSLTPKEFGILEILLKNQGKPVAANKLYEQVWNEEANASSTNTIMVHIRHLRCKLAEVDSSVEFIQTAWGVGYMIPADR